MTKGMEDVYKEISRLSLNDKKVILAKLISELPLSGELKNLNFYNLKGVGKEIWNGIDAQEYVNRERSSWD